MIAKWLSATPEFLYAYDKSGERFEAPVLGKRFSEQRVQSSGNRKWSYRFVEFVPLTWCWKKTLGFLWAEMLLTN